VLGPVAIGVSEVFVGDAAQLPAQLARHGHGVELGVLVHDRLNGIDVMRDQVGRHRAEIGRVLDDPAQAFGGGARGRVAEGGGIALDVVGGAEQLCVGSKAEMVESCEGRARLVVGPGRSPG